MKNFTYSNTTVWDSKGGCFPVEGGWGLAGGNLFFVVPTTGGCFLFSGTNYRGVFLKKVLECAEHSVGGNGTPIRPFWGVRVGWGSVWAGFFPPILGRILTFVRFNFDHEIFAFRGAFWSNASSIEKSVNVIPGTIPRVVFQEFHVNANVTAAPAPAVSSVALDVARERFASAAVSTGDAIKDYAGAMLHHFSVKDLATGALVTPWYDVVGGALGKGIKSERAKFVELFIARGFDKPTIDVYWSRVKIASGKPKTVTRVQSSGSALDDATLADLKTLINRILKSDEEDALAQQYKGDLMDVYAGLGGDCDKLGK